MFSIDNTIARLQQKNDKSYYLAILRVLISVWFLKELIFRSPGFETLYSTRSFLQLDSTKYLQLFHLDAVFLKQHYMVLIGICVLLLLLNLFGIGRNLTSFLLFIAFTILYHLDDRFCNGGDEMSMVVLFYLSFANTFSHLTLYKRKPLAAPKEKLYNLVSNLAAYSLIINLCISYFMAGLFKAGDANWQNGTGIYYFVNDDRYSVFAAGGRHVNMPFIISAIIGHGTIALELLFPFLIWDRWGRRIALSLCLLMHLGIYSFLMIYGLTLVFVIQYGMFFTNEEVLAAKEKIMAIMRKLFRFAPTN